MTILQKLFKCLCVCICVEKGSWSPKAEKFKSKSVLAKRLTKEKYKKSSDIYRPEWLKQWTISKGWMHDRSHMLTLGVKCEPVNNYEQKSVNNIGSDSSLSIGNASDLISVISNTNDYPESEMIKTESLKNQGETDLNNIEVDQTDLFSGIDINYRTNFPINKHLSFDKTNDNKQPDYFAFKKYFNLKEKEIKYTRILIPSRQQFFQKSKNLSKPVSKYKTFDDLTVLNYEDEEKKSKTRGAKLPNSGKFKRNVQQDTIYECSEDSFSLYNNPIYESNQYTENEQSNINTSPGFDKTSDCQYQKCLSNNLNTNKFNCRNTFIRGNNYGTLKSKLTPEKYIIRHIRIRIMLTLRLKKFQRLYRKRLKSIRKARLKKRQKIRQCESDIYSSGLKSGIVRMHDEQRRIGNGRTSLKIQNLRYGRLNVLRWLLWESQEAQGRTSADRAGVDCVEMPALEREHSNSASNTLALHYAAARGCLDCVRLLVDSTTELSANTQMDNDVTPVYLAAQEGHLEVLKFLVLEAGGSLYVRAKDGMAPLHAASQMGCLNCVKWMIQEQGVDPNLRDGDGATPLHFAASRGHLETVRWLLRHGARLSLDKYGKSPINDAAENQQVECLNVLVQHGATPDYNDSERSLKHSCSCTRKTDTQSRSSQGSDCNSCAKTNQEPFYLHPPNLPNQRTNTLEAPHAPQDGLYINPMQSHRHSTSSSSGSCSGDSVNGESFFLHNPQEVIYNRVRDLFETNANHNNQQKHQQLSALTVKVEVHSSSSGAGSDENLSSSDLSERSGDHDHDYEDIYLAREESKTSSKDRVSGIRSRSRDSGSHSRSGSASSSNSGCNVIVKLTPPNEAKKESSKSDVKRTNEFLPKPLKYEKPKKDEKNSDDNTISNSPSDLYMEEEHEKIKLAARYSLQPPKNQNKILKRVVSVPADISPPPPPPPPPANATDVENKKEISETVEVVEEPTVKPSDVVKGMVRSMSTINAAKRLNSSCSDLTIISLNIDAEETEKTGPNLVNKQRVLPFIPPSFPGSADSNCLIKPSEYLRSISDKRSSVSSSRCSDYEEQTVVIEEKKEEIKVAFSGPPPPPLPAPVNDQSQLLLKSSATHETLTDTNKKQQQPLSAISIHDLNSVQLRRTDKMLASKTFSAPTRSMSLQCLQSDNYISQKNDLISELKMSKDISGIKKLKVERAKVEEKQEKEMFSEITKQFTASNFVEKIPDKDNTGNVIPVWKRQMLAKKAAERARREMEEQLQREAEEKRLQAIPQWKRQLLAKKEETEIKIKSTIYTPKLVDEVRTVKPHDTEDCWRQHHFQETVVEKFSNGDSCNKENNKPEINVEPASKDNETHPEEEQNIIPWRAQLRKTNSKLNLLD